MKSILLQVLGKEEKLKKLYNYMNIKRILENAEESRIIWKISYSPSFQNFFFVTPIIFIILNS